VSNQFRVIIDDFFELIKWEEFMPRSEWQYKYWLFRERPSSTPDLYRGTMMQMLRQKTYTTSPRITQVHPMIRGKKMKMM